MSLQARLDAAVVAYRENPSDENREALAAVQEAWLADFYRRQREEAIANHERRQMKAAG